MSTLRLMSWSWSENLKSQAFHSDRQDLFLFFQPPLNLLPGIVFGQPRLEGDRERWLKTQSIHAAVRRSLLASHLFPFWCLLSTRCQRIWSPQMWSGLFSSGNLAHPAISYLYWFIPFFFFFALLLILVWSYLCSWTLLLAQRGPTPPKNMYFWP